jgi:hypothetical protein
MIFLEKAANRQENNKIRKFCGKIERFIKSKSNNGKIPFKAGQQKE